MAPRCLGGGGGWVEWGRPQVFIIVYLLWSPSLPAGGGPDGQVGLLQGAGLDGSTKRQPSLETHPHTHTGPGVARYNVHRGWG